MHAQRGRDLQDAFVLRVPCLATRGRADGAPVWRTRWLSPGPAGSPEASLSARPCPRLPRASAGLGQSAVWAALAPKPYWPRSPQSRRTVASTCRSRWCLGSPSALRA
eukprot:scaffold126643_cov60-Phaeocystis_antarctica.AAC.1